MNTHVKVLGWLYLAFGALGLLGAVMFGGLTVLASLFSGDADAAVAGGLIGTIVGVTMTLFSLPALLAGWGLLKQKSWARVLTIVLSIVSLPGIPFGTALGIYGLWAMFNDEVTAEFRRGKLAF